MKRIARRVMYFSGNWSRAHYWLGRRRKCACGKFERWEAEDLPELTWITISAKCWNAARSGR